MDFLKSSGVQEATYGRAAKMVAIYLKTRVVCSLDHESPLRELAHPPIDWVLLKALAADDSFSKAHRALWRQTKWTRLDAPAYARVIESLRVEGLDSGGFWRVEKWWIADRV